MNQDLSEAILLTLCYFDVYDYPVTAQELQRYLWGCRSQITLFELEQELRSGLAAGRYREQYGYYFLPGRDMVIEERRKKVITVEKKLAIARRAARKLRFIPFVRSVFVCNTVALGWPGENSDIDVLVVVAEGRLWLTRLLVTLVLSLFRLRRTKRSISDRICLSFYVTDKHLDLSDVALPGVDVYLIYWLLSLIPVYDPDDWYQKIMQENRWLKQYVNHLPDRYVVADYVLVTQTKLSRVLKRFLEKLWSTGYGAVLESQARAIQKSKMMRNRDSVQNAGDTRVVISDTRLKFHENDRRGLYRELWEKRVQGIRSLKSIY